jgi:hypothetical protein
MFATRTRERPPSPPWLGVVFTVALFGSAGWLLAYTLLPIRPVEALGAWNYLGALALLLAATATVAVWRGDNHSDLKDGTDDHSIPADHH